MEKLKHTSHNWHWHFEKTLNLAGKGSYENGDILRCKMGPGTGDRELILLAPTAPHSCADPTCPGDINRRKLQAAEEMARAMRRHIYPDCGCAVCDDARSLLAKTKEG